MTKKKNILIAAGGTGGHIYPALAIAKAIVNKQQNIDIQFVGTEQGLEKKIIPKSDFPLHYLPVKRLNKNVSLIERILTVLLLPLAFFKAFRLIAKYKPYAVFGVGGHASGPLLLMARLMGKKTLIWEPNAMPGLANRILGPYMSKGFVLFSSSKELMKLKKFEIVGYPLRDSILQAREQSKNFDNFNVFVFGGSQGARGINNALLEALNSSDQWLDGVQITWQTGATDFKKLELQFNELSESVRSHVKLVEFIEDMSVLYSWANLAICRCGMGTISELAAIGLPAILVPLPTAADNHQQKNAEELVKKGASKMVLQSDLNGELLIREISELKSNQQSMNDMSKSIHKFFIPEGAETIARQLIEESEH